MIATCLWHYFERVCRFERARHPERSIVMTWHHLEVAAFKIRSLIPCQASSSGGNSIAMQAAFD